VGTRPTGPIGRFISIDGYCGTLGRPSGPVKEIREEDGDQEEPQVGGQPPGPDRSAVRVQRDLVDLELAVALEHLLRGDAGVGFLEGVALGPGPELLLGCAPAADRRCR
jgi:hypothetical protein